jgi:hypothetical protein
MHKYKVTFIAMTMVDWNSLASAIFGEANTVWAEFGGQHGEFHFATPQTPADLGPLIRVELISQ